MAIDTQQKRSSAISFGVAFAPVLPPADGSIDQADRQDVAGYYSGIAAGEPPAPPAAPAQTELYVQVPREKRGRASSPTALFDYMGLSKPRGRRK